MVNAKSLTIQSKTATIKLETNTLWKDKQNVKAIYALLGGYNEVARNVNIDYFHKLQEKLQAAINDMAYAIDLADTAAAERLETIA